MAEKIKATGKRISSMFFVPKAYRKDVMGDLRQLNMNRMLIISFLVLAGEMISFISRYMAGVSYMDSGSLLVVALFKTFYTLVYIVAYVVLKVKNARRSTAARVINILFLTALLVVQLHMSRYEYATRGALYNFFFGLMVVLVGVIMTNLECLLFTGAYSGFMLWVTLGGTGVPKAPFNIINLVVMLAVITMVGSRSYYSSFIKTRLTTRQLIESRALMEQLSMTDQLTQINNRRGFYHEAEWLLGDCIREKEPIAFIIADIDKFKYFNDRYGHLMGDRCLERIAACLREVFCRKTDCIARFGGEEFVAVFKVDGDDEAVQQANRLVQAVEALAIAHEENANGQVVTVSVGVYSCVPEKDDTGEALMKKADVALYQAKKRGGNVVTLFNETMQ